MAAEVLALLVQTNLAAAAGILLVLTARRPLREVFGAQVAYRLWLMAPISICASLLPARTIVLTQTGPVAPVGEPTVATTSMVVAGSTTPVETGALVVGLWLAGVGVGLALLFWRQRRFIASLGSLAREGDIFRATTASVGPAVLGVLFPRIVLPADFEERYDAAEQKVVLAHEAAHLAARDSAVNAFSALVQCLFWFNPLVHVAGRALRIDQELACDAAVLAAYPSERRAYAQALLKTQLAATPAPLGCYWPSGRSNPLKERIAMLKSAAPSRARRLCGGAGIFAVCIGTGFAAWAAQPPRVELKPAPPPVVHPATATPDAVTPRPALTPAAAIAGARTGAALSDDASPAQAEALKLAVATDGGRTYAKVDATPTKPPFNSLVAITADGHQRTFPLPLKLPTPPTPPRPPGWVPVALEELPEPENVRLGRLAIAAAEVKQERRAAAGEPPQPLTRELAAALTSVPRFDRDALKRRMEIHKLERRQSRQLALKFFDDAIARTANDPVEHQKYVEGREKYIRLIIESD